MESYIPTRPSSDLHRRLSARKRPPPAMETQGGALSGPARRDRQRSSSFSALSQTLHRLMPSNRPERGGTMRPMDNEGKHIDSWSPPKSLLETFSLRGRADEREDEGEEMRRTKSWSPKKSANGAGESNYVFHRANKLKKPSTLKKLWDLHKSVKLDEGTDDFWQHPSRLRSEERELRQAERAIPSTNLTLPQTPAKQVMPTAIDIQESVAVLKRSQQIYEEKKARREERRSFRESDDFIGVQGANPQTGYPDPSTATSSSAGDVISESTRQKLEEDEKRMATASREYKAALERRENEMRRLEMERERRRREKKERAEKKRTQLRARVRKDGRWKNDGNTWSMVSEPGLSPIMQSIAATPIQETVPSHRGLTTPITTKEESTARLAPRIEEDYFHRAPPRPRTSTQFVQPTLKTPMNHKDLSYRIKTPSGTDQPSVLSLKAHSLYGDIPVTPTRSDHIVTLPIRRKEAGSGILRRRASSSETVIHNIETDQSLPVELPDNPRLVSNATPPSVPPRVHVTTPGETTHMLSSISPSAGGESFLEILRGPSECEEPREDEAIGISCPSALMNQALTHLSSLQNPKDTSQANRIKSLQDFPPVLLKDPISARIPLNAQSQRIPLPSPVLKAKATFLQQGPANQPQSTITPIITTTGFVEVPCPPSQTDGFKDAWEDQMSPQRLTLPNSRNPITNFHSKEMPNGMLSSGSQVNQADIATSSAHHHPAFSTPTKRPVPRLCQPLTSDLGKQDTKSTLISTSTSPQRQSATRQNIARNAAQAAFLGASPQRLGSEVKARSSSLVSPKVRSAEAVERLGQGRKMFSGGSVDIGDPSRTREEPEKNRQLLGKRIEQARQLSGPSRDGGGEEDRLTVWCTDVEKRVRFADEKTPAAQKKRPGGLPRKALKGTHSLAGKKPKGSSEEDIAKVSTLRDVYELVMWAIGAAWWFVSPVFNPRSGLRWRWGRKELTWRDILLISAAAIFGGGVFLLMVLLAKVIGMGLRIVKGCIRVGHVLTNFWRSYED